MSQEEICSITNFKTDTNSLKKKPKAIQNTPTKTGHLKKKRSHSKGDCSNAKQDELSPCSKKQKQLECSETYEEFMMLVDRIFEDVDFVDDFSPSTSAISNAHIKELCKLTENLKKLDITDSIPLEKLTKLLMVLDCNLKSSNDIVLISSSSDTVREKDLINKIMYESYLTGLDCSWCILHILTSPRIDQRLFVEEIIDRLITFGKCQLKYLVVLAANKKLKLQHQKGLQNCNLLCELIDNKIMTDTIILKASSLGVSIFFSEQETNHLLVSSMNLLVLIFSKYEKHRKLIFEEVLSSVTKLADKKTPAENKEKFTELILHLCQSVANSDIRLDYTTAKVKNIFDTDKNLTTYFLTTFLEKCKTQPENNYIPIFNCFVQQLVLNINKLEWPAAEFVLSILGLILVNFASKHSEVHFKVMCLDYLGSIAVMLQKEAIKYESLKTRISKIILLIQGKPETSGIVKTDLLEEAILRYYKSAKSTGSFLKFAQFFTIVQWYNEVYQENFAPRIVHEKVHIPDLDYNSASTLLYHFNFKRQFFHSFDLYLKRIVTVLKDHSVLIRTKVIKVLSLIIDENPNILDVQHVQLAVKYSLYDSSISVREAILDLLGKFILKNNKFIDIYVDMIMSRILDVGLSVRKKVITTLNEIVLHNLDLPIIPEICNKIIKRINDEETIKKSVLDLFQQIWFSPVNLESNTVQKRVDHMVKTVMEADMFELEPFENLLENLFSSSEQTTKTMINVAKQMIGKLFEKSETNDLTAKTTCFIILLKFAKVCPKLFIPYIETLHANLLFSCQTLEGQTIVKCVAKILELVIPLIKNPDLSLISSLEKDSTKLILNQEPKIIYSCMSFLSTIINKVSHNYALVVENFDSLFKYIKNYKKLLDFELKKSSMDQCIDRWKLKFSRTVLSIGLFLQFFDFDNVDLLKDKFPHDLIDIVYSSFIFFIRNDSDSILFTLKAFGAICIRYTKLLLKEDLKSIYHKTLIDGETPLNLKIQVLRNIGSFITEVDNKMADKEKNWLKQSKKENLKEMNDLESGISSTVLQLYLEDIFVSLKHAHSGVRYWAFKIVKVAVNQGLVHPLPLVPYIISMTVEEGVEIRSNAEQLLAEIESKYPGYVHMKVQSGMKLSYKLQTFLQTQVVRGYKTVNNEPVAMNNYLYMLLEMYKHRRSLLLTIIREFEPDRKNSLSKLIYFADNLGHFTYKTQDDVLYVLHQINVFMSVHGLNLMHAYSDSFTLHNANIDDEDTDDEETIIQLIPNDLTKLRNVSASSNGCHLLLSIKEHLKFVYGFSDKKIANYSLTKTSRTNNIPAVKKHLRLFQPNPILQKLFIEDSTNCMEDEEKLYLAKQYLDFKFLLMKYDLKE
ncbi:nipped-B-like protein A isoform X2 [Cimex lectularius]|nr:nipped-B-like protein A isoform X2 [Cimex lectularius]